MGYSSPLGKSSIFTPDDSEFYHGPAIVNVGKVIRDLVSYSQSSSKLYYRRSNYLVVFNSEKYRVYDGEQWRKLDIHAKISNLEGDVDINANTAVLRADAPDFGGDGTEYKLYIPFAEQNGTSGDINYAFCIYSTDLYDFLWFIDLVFAGVRETVFLHLWNFAKRDMERAGGDERKVAQWYQNNSPWILVGINEDERIKHLSIIINSKRAVNTVGTNEEKAVLNLLDSFKPAYNNDTNTAKNLKELENTPASKLLKALLRANGGGDILFERLYSRMNNFFGAKNFTKCVQTLFLLWENSIFLLPDNALYNGNTAPDNIPYSSEKKVGFYTSNFKLTRNKEKIDVKKKKLVTVPQQLPDMPETKAVVFEDFATYHLYQPILPIESERQAVSEGEKSNAQKSEIPVPQCAIPAFYLLAVEDQNFWANFQFGMQIGIEIITTLSGVGNLFKLRHLRHLSKLEGVVVSLGAIQVVSGAIGVMLNFIDENDSKYGPFCSKLRNVLIFIDLASLGADAIASKLLRDAAKEALEESRKLKLILEEAEETERVAKETEKAAKIAKDEEEIEQIEKELEKIAGEEVAEQVPKTPHELMLQKMKKVIDEVEADMPNLHGNNKPNNHTRETNYSEMKATYEFLSKDWTIAGKKGKLELIFGHTLDNLDAPIEKGIDGIFKFTNPPPHYIINEVKWNKARLSTEITKSGGSQMQDVWINYLLPESVDLITYAEITNKKYIRILTTVSKEGKVSYKELDKFANVIKQNWP